MEKKKLIVVIEGPSGVGKDSIMQGLEKHFPMLYQKIASFATREKRPGEIDGKTYFFINEEQFKGKIKSGDIFEHTQRHGSYRGLSRSVIDKILDSGKTALKDADLIGVAALKKAYPNQVITIFIKAKKEEIEKRLKNRGDSAEDLARRLADYDNMMKDENQFDYSIENKSLKTTIEKIHKIIQISRG